MTCWRGASGHFPRVSRSWLAALTATLVLVAGWTLLQRIPGALPAAANALRWLVGDRAVTRLEDGVYSLTDQVKRRAYRHRAPEAHWAVEAPSAAPAASSVSTIGAPAPEPSIPSFRPVDVGPMQAENAAPGDGVWLPAEPGATAADALSFKTLLHPDPERSYAELFVVALDLARVELHAMAGSSEPENSAPGAQAYQRRARVPEPHQASLLAAFNGGFKSTHGHFGMRVEGVTLAPPRPHSCTIAMQKDGKLAIGTFSQLDNVDGMVWFRQTPRCMVERGVRHPNLANSRSWGATLDGKTVIRRSAIGLDERGNVLFVGISNSTTADALARGMQHAGAHTVAQLDVNYSFPRFLFYAPAANGLETVPLAQGFVYSEGQYIEHRSARDFFYLTRSSRAVRGKTGEIPWG